MTHPFRNTALELYMDVLPSLRDAGRTIRAHDKNHARQLDSAAQSVALNLAEADTRCPGNSRARLDTAFASLREVRTNLRVAVIYEHIEEETHQPIDAVLDRVTAMIWRRRNARRRR